MTDAVDDERCDLCGEWPWNVRFRWDYTSDEYYCAACLLRELEGQPGKGLIDFLPECQDITHRLTNAAGEVVGRPVHYQRVRGTARSLYPVLTGRLG